MKTRLASGLVLGLTPNPVGVPYPHLDSGTSIHVHWPGFALMGPGAGASGLVGSSACVSTGCVSGTVGGSELGSGEGFFSVGCSVGDASGADGSGFVEPSGLVVSWVVSLPGVSVGPQAAEKPAAVNRLTVSQRMILVMTQSFPIRMLDTFFRTFFVCLEKTLTLAEKGGMGQEGWLVLLGRV